jgi:hypothetical protein
MAISTVIILVIEAGGHRRCSFFANKTCPESRSTRSAAAYGASGTKRAAAAGAASARAPGATADRAPECVFAARSLPRARPASRPSLPSASAPSLPSAVVAHVPQWRPCHHTTSTVTPARKCRPDARAAGVEIVAPWATRPTSTAARRRRLCSCWSPTRAT